jgi:hypothetical protein
MPPKKQLSEGDQELVRRWIVLYGFQWRFLHCARSGGPSI